MFGVGDRHRPGQQEALGQVASPGADVLQPEPDTVELIAVTMVDDRFAGHTLEDSWVS